MSVANALLRADAGRGALAMSIARPFSPLAGRRCREAADEGGSLLELRFSLLDLAQSVEAERLRDLPSRQDGLRDHFSHRRRELEAMSIANALLRADAGRGLSP